MVLKLSLLLVRIIALSGCLCTRGQHMLPCWLRAGGRQQSNANALAVTFVRAMNVRAVLRACFASHIGLSDKSGLEAALACASPERKGICRRRRQARMQAGRQWVGAAQASAAALSALHACVRASSGLVVACMAPWGAVLHFLDVVHLPWYLPE